MILMRYYRSNNGAITCLLCKHYCKLRPDQTGICGVNQNKNGELNPLSFGYLSAINIDPIEKKPLYHFLPNSKSFSIGTVGCNFRCPFCQNWHISQTVSIDKSRYFEPDQVVQMAVNNDCKSISYTYNEPAIWYPYAKEVGVLAKEAGLKNILITSGYESDEVLSDMVQFVDGLNIDLKSFDKHYYKRSLKADLEKVCETIKAVAQSKMHLEVTTLMIPNIDTDQIEKMADFLVSSGVTIWHLSAFFPHYKMQEAKPTTLSTLRQAKEIAIRAGIEFVYLGNVATDQNTYCPECQNLLVSRNGYSAKIAGLESSKCVKCGKFIEGVWSD